MLAARSGLVPRLRVRAGREEAGTAPGRRPGDGVLATTVREPAVSYAGGRTLGLGTASAVTGSARIALTLGTAAAEATRPALRRT